MELERNKEGVRIAIKDVASHPFRMPKLVAQKAYWLLYKDDDGIWAAESYGNDYFIPNFRREVLVVRRERIYYADWGSSCSLGAARVRAGAGPAAAVVALTMLYVLAIPLVFFGDPALPLSRRCRSRW